MKQKLTFFLLWGVLLVAFLPGCTRYYGGPPSDHFDGTRFFNPGPPDTKGFSDFLRWRMTADPQPWPSQVQQNTRNDQPPARVAGRDLQVTNIGHMTFLLQTAGVNILTDPVFSDRASPVSFAGPKRVHAPGLSFDQLPKIDVVLVSHNHYDHLDLATLKKLWRRDQPRIIVPLGNDTIIQKFDATIKAEAYDWGDRVAINDNVAVVLGPMQHWSARGLFDRKKALWAAFTIVTPGGNIHFVGDSGYSPHFKAARKEFGSFRLAILPIGAYEPRWFMTDNHMNPHEAVQAMLDLGAPYTVAGHYDVFQLADEGYGEAGPALEAAKKELAVQGPTMRFEQRAIGESWSVP